MARTEHYNLNKPAGTDVGDISALNDNMDVIDSELYSRVKSLNGVTPDENGNLTVTTVSLAENLTSSYNVTKSEEFVIRTTSGASSVSDGSGTLEAILGVSRREGYVAPVVEWTVNNAARTGDEEEITAEVNKDEFLENEPSGGTITITYDTNAWVSSPAPPSGVDVLAYYAVTVVGTPKDGDEIVIEYTEAVLGTIVNSTPTGFMSTGWNLYNDQNKYARVAAYSDGTNSNRYMISGNKTAVKFSATRDGARQTLTLDASGRFTVPSDGYVWVDGGDSTTAIWATWSDWTGGYSGDFQLYTQNVIDISSVMLNAFPYGLMQVGSYRDEINFSVGKAYQRIERLTNNSENMTAAKNSGRPYQYDDSFIYLVRETVGESSFTISNAYPLADHGTELFEGTTVPAIARTIFGANLKNKLERDVLTVSSQDLSDAQKEQVRENIGAASATLADEMSGILTGLFKRVAYTFTTPSIAANATLKVTAADLGVEAIEGYTPMWIYRFSSGSKGLNIYTTYPAINASDTVVTLHNSNASAVSGKKVTVGYVWVKTSAT